MAASARRPRPIVTRAKLLSRLAEIADAFDFLKIHSGSEWALVQLNPLILRDALQKYYEDLRHTKCSNGIKFADRHKRAGFTFKWICKLRPVQVIIDSSNAQKVGWKALVANEMLAVYVAATFLEIRPDQLRVHFVNALMNIAHRRDIDGELCSAMMYLLEESGKSGRRKPS